ncbi:E2F-associated phosphoprotein isoform X1 [Marmota monax]|nr:E2F-associated phosphoprotein isoform X1 [Marmota monax]
MAGMALARAWKQMSWFYYQYLLVTALYMLEPWERTVFSILPGPLEREPGSEDEVDVLLHGTPDQKRKLIRECLTGESESSSEDEFEKEMEAELNSTIKTMEDKLSSLGTGSSSGNNKVGIAPAKYYDDIYFDSDSEDEDKSAQVTKKKKKKRHRIPTNDELLYDPEKDNRDQAWVDAQRRG